MKPKLERLKKALAGPRPMTAKQLARALACSIPTVHRRIEELRAEVAVNTIIEGAGTRRGPKPARFHIGRRG